MNTFREIPQGLRRVPVVYLAGGMRSNWQDKVKKALSAGGPVHIIDPREHAQEDEQDYTAWDLSGVAMADIVFGYLEKDNPNGAGLAVEFGYGAAQGKILYLVEEDGFPFTRYFGMVRAVSHRTSNSLDAGVSDLRHYLFGKRD